MLPSLPNKDGRGGAGPRGVGWASGAVHPKQAKVDSGAEDRAGVPRHGRRAAQAAAEFDPACHARGELPSELREVPVLVRLRRRSAAHARAGGCRPGKLDQRGGPERFSRAALKISGEKVGDLKARVARTSLPLVVQAGRHAVRLDR